MAQTNGEISQISAPSQFQRGCHKCDSFTLPTSVNNAVVFPFHGHSGGSIYVDGAGGGTITWYSTYDRGVTATKCHKADGTAITSTLTEAGWHEIPPELFGVPFLAPVINSGTVAAILVLKK